MKVRLHGLIAFLLVASCGGAPVPQDQLAASQAAVRAAEVGGAPSDPQASLLVKKAQEQIEDGKKLIEGGNNERAKMVLMRAEADADLALALAQEITTKNEAEEAKKQVAELRQRSGKK